MSFLPIVIAADLSTVRLVDVRSAPLVDFRKAKEVGVGLLSSLLQRSRPGTSLCERRHVETANGWEQAPMGCDPSLPGLTFVVYEHSARPMPPLGLFEMYDIVRESDTPQRNTVTAKGMPAFLAPGRDELHTSWALAMRDVLEVDLEFERDGRKLDVTGWDFPDLDGHRWASGGHADDRADDILTTLARNTHPITRRADGSPETIRRAGT